MSKSKTSNKGKQMAKDNDVQNITTGTEGTNENQQDIQQVEEGLIGSDLVPSSFVVDGKEVTAGDYIRELFSTTGLTINEWNGLSVEERNSKVKEGLDALGISLDTTDSDVLENQTDDNNETPLPSKTEDQISVGTIIQQSTETVSSNDEVLVVDDFHFNFRGIEPSTELKTLIEETAKLDDYSNTILNGLFDYMTEMRPKRQMSLKDGGSHQATLYRLIRYMFITENNNFSKVFGVFLAIVNEFKDTGKVFNERYLFRFPESVQLNQSEAETLWKWLHLIIVTSDVKDRKNALSQVNVNKALAANLTENARNKIINFYNV